jgi:hypothetical protein
MSKSFYPQTTEGGGIIKKTEVVPSLDFCLSHFWAVLSKGFENAINQNWRNPMSKTNYKELRGEVKASKAGFVLSSSESFQRPCVGFVRENGAYCLLRSRCQWPMRSTHSREGAARHARACLNGRATKHLQAPKKVTIRTTHVRGPFFFFLPGGLLRKQGPRGARLRGAPLPRSHNALVATSCLCFPTGGPSEGAS